jgi:hypothetical protein
MSSSDGVVKKLFEKGYITQQQMDAVMAANPPGGDAVQLLISWGFATQEHVSLAMEPPKPPPPQPFVPVQPPQFQGAPDLTMDTVQTSKFKIDLKTLIYIGTLVVTAVAGYFTFMGELDTRFSSLEGKDNELMVDVDKRLTGLETKFTPIGDGVYSVDPTGTWPPSRTEYNMKDQMARNSITKIKEDIEDLQKDIEKIETKLFNGK